MAPQTLGSAHVLPAAVEPGKEGNARVLVDAGVAVRFKEPDSGLRGGSCSTPALLENDPSAKVGSRRSLLPFFR